jgi:4-carboxymuconolactone decarboxylase
MTTRKEHRNLQESISPAGRALIRISACLAGARYKRLEVYIREALAQKVAASKIYEVLLQSYLFLGYPKALEAIKIFRRVCDHETRPSRINYSFRNWPDWKIRGTVLCEKVYGDNYDKLVKRVGEISPELSEWMIVEGYGKVLSRGAVAGMMRELCTVAALLVTSDINQLHSHMRGAKNLGAGRNEILKTMEIASEFCTRQKINRGQKLFKLVFKE